MALWGNSANITRKTAGIVTCNYSTLEVVGSGTSFGLTTSDGVGYAKTGQIIRFGVRGGAGGADADVIDLGQNVTGAITADSTLTFKRAQNGYDAYVYGVSEVGVGTGTQYQTSAGWVGVQTYMDSDNNLRVKKEVLVAMSGITTGNPESYPPE